MARAVRIMRTSGEEEGTVSARGEGRGPTHHDELLEQTAAQVMSVLPRIVRTIKHSARAAEEDSRIGELGGSQMMVLHRLTEGSQLTSELARRFNVSTPTMTRIIDALVDKGYVEREHDPEDRRRIYLRLTESGRKMGDYAHQVARNALASFFRPLSNHQLTEIMKCMGYMESLIPDERGGYCPVQPAPTNN